MSTTVAEVLSAVFKAPRRKPKGKSPTARAMDELRKLGFQVQVVEKWNSFTHTRNDLFGCIDLIACKPGIGIVGIQATSGENHAARRTKSLAEPKLRVWLESGARFELMSFAKRGERGARKLWTMRREEITIQDIGTL